MGQSRPEKKHEQFFLQAVGTELCPRTLFMSFELLLRIRSLEPRGKATDRYGLRGLNLP